MKNKIFTTMIVLIFTSMFSACGGGGGGSSTTSTTTAVLADITLSAGGSSTCTSATSFSVTPTDDPVVVFSTDAVSGDTTITIDSASSGSVLIQNCTVR